MKNNEPCFSASLPALTLFLKHVRRSEERCLTSAVSLCSKKLSCCYYFLCVRHSEGFLF